MYANEWLERRRSVMKQVPGVIMGLNRSGYPISFPQFTVETEFGIHRIQAGSPLNERDDEDKRRRRLYQGMLTENAEVIVIYKWRLFGWLFGAHVVRKA